MPPGVGSSWRAGVRHSALLALVAHWSSSPAGTSINSSRKSSSVLRGLRSPCWLASSAGDWAARAAGSWASRGVELDGSGQIDVKEFLQMQLQKMQQQLEADFAEWHARAGSAESETTYSRV